MFVQKRKVSDMMHNGIQLLNIKIMAKFKVSSVEAKKWANNIYGGKDTKRINV